VDNLLKNSLTTDGVGLAVKLMLFSPTEKIFIFH
jgi:hypothetical protein